MTNNERLKQAQRELANARRLYGNYIPGPMGKLHITIIKAENLVGTSNSHVICYQGSKQNQTRSGKGPDPVYGDS